MTNSKPAWSARGPALWLAGVALACLPCLQTVGPGPGNALGRWQLGVLHRGLEAELALLRNTHLMDLPAVWIWLPALLGGLAWRIPRGRGVSAGIWLLRALALIPLCWVALVVCSLHPMLLLGIVALLALAPLEEPTAAGQGAEVALASLLVLAASATSDQGSAPHSPPFLLGGLLAGGGPAWATGGVVLLVGAGLAGWRRDALTARDGVLLGGLGAAVLLADALAGWPAHLALGRGLASVGLLLGVRGLAASPALSMPSRSALALLAGAGALLVVGLWTRPTALPTGVELLAPVTGVFSVAVEPDSGVIGWSSRQRAEVGWLSPDGVTGRWGPGAGWSEGDQVEAVHALDGGFVASVWTAEEAGALVPWSPASPPGEPIPTGRCNPTAWTPRDDGVLVGCEGDSQLALLRGGRLTPQARLDRGAEHVEFSDDGATLWSVMLWGSPLLTESAWPSGRTLRTADTGPLNWTLSRDARRAELWVGRFIEGEALVLDERSLTVQRSVPLSFGVRAMVRDEVGDRLWAAAAYSGVLWLIDGPDLARRTAYGLCGQARDLALDRQGRVIVGTDCGLYRVTPPGSSTLIKPH